MVLVLVPIALSITERAAAGSAPSADTIAVVLPRAFGGLFRWRDAPGLQTVLVRFSRVRVTSDGLVEATGRGTNFTGVRVTTFDVRALIDPDTLGLRMWETNPSGDNIEGYVTDGLYEGRVSEDLRRLEARWRTNGNGDAGDLVLIAEGDESGT